MIEAGTPFIKREGMSGVNALARMWPGIVVADIKVSDGAIGEVDMVARAGARAITALGLAPVGPCVVHRTLQAVRHHLDDRHAEVEDLKVLRPLYTQPDVVVIHRGRDEESNQATMIRYRHINRIRQQV